VAAVEQVLAPAEVLATAARSLGAAGAALSLTLATDRVECGVRAADEVEVVDNDSCVGSCARIACR